MYTIVHKTEESVQTPYMYTEHPNHVLYVTHTAKRAHMFNVSIYLKCTKVHTAAIQMMYKVKLTYLHTTLIGRSNLH